MKLALVIGIIGFNTLPQIKHVAQQAKTETVAVVKPLPTDIQRIFRTQA